MLIRQAADNGVTFYTSPLLSAAGARHGFTTRIGGISAAPFDSLNLGNPPGALRDTEQNVAHNLGRVEAALELSGRRRMWVHQVHGNRAAIADEESFENGSPADALLGSNPSTYLMVRVADCVPILLATPNGGWVAAIHAGWRGVIAEVVLESVKMLTASAAVDATQLIAAIGPCISRAAFEVGPEVVAEFEKRFANSVLWSDRHVDLPAAVEMQLRASGIPSGRIDRTDRCTFRDQDEFFSHRRDKGVTGRMAAVIGPAHFKAN